MTTTATKIEKRSVAEQMTQAGNQQLAELRQNIEQLESQITEAQAEIEALHQAKATRTHAIAEARAAFADVEASYNQARGYAGLQHERTGERDAIKAAAEAKKNWQAARKNLTTLIEEDEAATRQADERETMLHKLKQTITFELETRQEEERVVQAGWEKAFSEWGIERYERLTTEFQQKQQLVDEALGQLVNARVEAHECHEQALMELAEWPDLQTDMARMVPMEDAILRMLKATEEYYSSVLLLMPQIDTLPSELQRRGLDLGTVLRIDVTEIDQAHHHPQWGQPRLELTRKLIREYQTWLAMQE